MNDKVKSGEAPGHDIVVIGGSAGSTQAFVTVLSALPKSLPAALFIAYHIPPASEGILHAMLAESVRMKVKLADDGEPILKGVVYVARPDLHLLVERDRVRVARGPRENRWRPAIDPLFRSAAVAYGTRVIGIVLTGMLDDGTAGLAAIKRCGGLVVAQDPLDAAYPEMPQSAAVNVELDHRVAARDMGRLIERLVVEPAGPSPAVPREIAEEARTAARGVPVASPEVVYTCPDCGGPLQRAGQDSREGVERYRCIVGHAWSAESLLSNTNETLEVSIWAAIRLFRQRAHLLASRAERERENGRARAAGHYDEQTRESLEHARQLQELVMRRIELREAETAGEGDAATGAKKAASA